MAEAIIISIAAKVSEYLVAPIKHQLGYLFNYHSNVEDLRSQLEKLEDVKQRVDREIIIARRNGDEIATDVERWLKSVNGITEEAGNFLDYEDKAKKRCFNELCPNLKLRYQLNKKAKKTTQEVVKIQTDGKFDRVSYPALLQQIGFTLAKGYEAFESRISTFKEIIEALRNPNINVIGVYGMAGVGKTTLVKEIAKQAKEEKLFDEVVMVVVARTPDLKKIQVEIAEMLGLKFDRDSEYGRAGHLHERLKNQKILVILDDIWGRLDLEAVGIPFGNDRVYHKEQVIPLKIAGDSIEDTDNESEIKGCKILLTSRNQDVLSNQMDTQINFGIGLLLEQEAWNLFKKMAGDFVEDPDLRPTAIEVARKCACLPIAIVTVAKALKNKNLFVWKDALQQLQRSNPTNIMAMHADVYSSIELSYNHLENDEVKSFFLLCGILRNQILIEDLLKYGMGLGLFQDVNTLEEARNRVYTLVHNLKASCLFLDSEIGWVEMHEVVRDVAISIASRDPNGFMVRYGVELKQWPQKDVQKNCTAISLPYSNICELPQLLDCPKLKFFFLCSSDPALKIPDNFLKEMKELKVLDLTGIHFSPLPSSLHFLVNLQTLCLHYCMLGDLAKIRELKNLEILSLIGSDIIQLPREIGQLTRLRLLDLKECSKLKVIPPNVISSLSRLEDFCMENCFVQWEINGLNNQRRNASLLELKNLSCLISLKVHIPDARVLPKGLLFENLIRYRILVGDVWDWSGDNESSRTLKLKLNTSIHLEDGVYMLLKRTEDLYLDRLSGTKNILYGLDTEGFQQLKHLHVQNNPEFQYIINSMEWVPCSAFPILKSLLLSNLTNLQEICHGPLPLELFRKLRVIEVVCCDELKNLFSLSLARGLLGLQEMKITDCKIMDGIVAEGREDEDNNEVMDQIMFPQLRHLTLQRLPELLSFWSMPKTIPSIVLRRQKLSTTDAVSGEIISEGEHDIPTLLFNKKVAFPSLEFLRLSELSKLKQIWHGQPSVESCNLRHLVVEKCALLSNVVSSNFLKSLQNLVIITVKSCDLVERVFDLEGLKCDEEHAGLLSRLDKLNLIALPKLRCIWDKDPHGILYFRNLKWLKIQKCNSLRNLFSPSMALDLVQLQELNITDCLMMEEIVEKDKGATEEAIDKIVFPLLTDIILEGLPNLMSFYLGNYIFECPFLKEMTIAGCPEIRTFTSTYEVLQKTYGNGNLDVPCAPLFNEQVAFPNLEKLIVTSVSLKEIWHYQLPVGSFCKLKYLKVESCHHLLNIVPSTMLMRLQNIESLSVFNSGGSLEYIFDLRGLNNTERHVVRATQLRYLDLYYLPSLKQIWKNDSQEIFPFQKLSSLAVYDCSKLSNIFTTFVAKSLVQLRELSIQSCGMLVEIVEKEGVGEEPMDRIVFPQLTSLKLSYLWKLKSFCQRIHISEWPSLKTLEVSRCYDVEIFASELISIKGTPTKQPLFLVDKVAFPKLEKLELYYMFSMKEIWQGQFHTQSFCKLRVLNVKGCQEILKVFPISLLQNLLNLEELSVESCEALEEVFELEGAVGEVGHAATLPQLRELRLTKLPKLMHLWKKNSQLSPIFQNLRTLEVSSCKTLTHLVPSAIAKCLVEIKSISVYECKMMGEIIASEEGEATNETIFSQLNSLELKNLSKLTSFCPGSSSFSFPSLVNIMVEGCPKMKIFSNGILSTPKLEKVHVQEDEWLWEGDLNSTIQHLFVQKLQFTILQSKRGVVRMLARSSSFP